MLNHNSCTILTNSLQCNKFARINADSRAGPFSTVGRQAFSQWCEASDKHLGKIQDSCLYIGHWRGIMIKFTRYTFLRVKNLTSQQQGSVSSTSYRTEGRLIERFSTDPWAFIKPSLKLSYSCEPSTCINLANLPYIFIFHEDLGGVI